MPTQWLYAHISTCFLYLPRTHPQQCMFVALTLPVWIIYCPWVRLFWGHKRSLLSFQRHVQIVLCNKLQFHSWQEMCSIQHHTPKPTWTLFRGWQQLVSMTGHQLAAFLFPSSPFKRGGTDLKCVQMPPNANTFHEFVCLSQQTAHDCLQKHKS